MFHATIENKAEKGRSHVGPARKTAKNAVSAAIKTAGTEYDTDVRLSLYEDDTLMMTAHGDSLVGVQDEANAMLNRNRRRY